MRIGRLSAAASLCALVLGLGGCPQTVPIGPSIDGGRADAGAVDAGPYVDAGGADAGSPDSGATDAGVDAGTSDGGLLDAGSTDGGGADAGMGCTTAADCSSGATPTGALYCAGTGCGTPGTCQPEPGSCSSVLDPVCGCDGLTYVNDCFAEASGTRVASEGTCSTPLDAGQPDAGGSLCGNRPCPTGTLCCEETGACYPASCLACCPTLVPDGGMACIENAECSVSPTPLTHEYCAGNGCNTPGSCAQEPTMCAGVLAPVCGCDDQTYTSACEAASAGVRVDYSGSCASGDAGTPDAGTVVCGNEMTCAPGFACCAGTGRCYPEACLACCLSSVPDAGSGCTSDSDCAAGEYCAGTGCDTPGSCSAPPSACPGVVDPVCGCDGKTYANACYAEQALVRVASQGICGAADGGPGLCGLIPCPTGDTCCLETGRCYDPMTCPDCCTVVPPPDAGNADAGPSTCSRDADCPAREYCAGTGCGTPGACQPEPTVCPLPLLFPACGCDGMTYGNDCLAEEAGVRVAHEGACSALDAGTGCTTDSQCMGGQICCQYTDQCVSARCTDCCLPPTPDAGSVCPPGMVCDGGVTSGCMTNSDCTTGDYCDGTECSGAGTCTVIPRFCPLIIDPVCGCDGVTYGNSCEAAQAGERVEGLGACGSTADGGAGVCTSNADCPMGDLCCMTTGSCYSRACLACCPIF